MKQRFDDYLQSDDSSGPDSSSEEDFEADQSNEDSTSDTSKKSKKAKKYLDTALVFIAYSKAKSQQEFNEEQYRVTGEKTHTRRFQKSEISLQSLACLLAK